MRYIKGVVFTNAYASGYSSDAAKASLNEMLRQSACNTVVFVLSAIQNCTKDSQINYRHTYMPKDQDIIDIITYARSIGLQTILKPEILCMDGKTQTDIATCHKAEGEESYWFQEYTEYIMHYAKVAQKAEADMYIIGCELVELEKKESYWRNLICRIRMVYDGYLTYNADRFREANVMWWDALDYISANGFYKNNELPSQLHRIDEIRKKYNKPFFFSEVRCKSCEGGSEEPEDWKHQGKVSLNEQAAYFNEFMKIANQTESLDGMVIYNWWQDEKEMRQIECDNGYNIYGKPVCDVLKKEWNESDGNESED